MANQTIDVQTILKGKIVFNPEYKEQIVEEYNGNPFIESLPCIFNDEDIIDEFTIYPKIDESEKHSPLNVRYHYIKRIKNFVQPLDIHFKIERKLSTMIRRGYIARNPNTKEYHERLRLINTVQNQTENMKLGKLEEINETLRSTAESFSITGISGIGKSISIERLLLMYPQVIAHEEYSGAPFTRTQIVWLKLDSPHDGSIKTLCKMFFKAIDDILNTTFSKKFGSNRNSTATMMIHMTYLASLYAIGVIVIDEIQHLTNTKQNPEEILNFIVTLVNTIGVPIIMIGTPSAERILKRNFRQARRAEGIGSITWQRMEKNETWDFFVETMWEYQWLEEYTSLTDMLNDTLYDECQGITALAVNIFMLAQELALESECSQLTVGLFREVSKTDLRLVQNMINALRTGNIQEIAKYDDIVNNLDEIMLNRKIGIDHREHIQKLSRDEKLKNKVKKNSAIQDIVAEILALGMFKNVNANDIERIINGAYETGLNDEKYPELKQFVMRELLELESRNSKTQDSKTKHEEKFSKNDLRNILKKANSNQKPCYELLKESGYIKNPFLEYYKDFS